MNLLWRGCLGRAGGSRALGACFLFFWKIPANESRWNCVFALWQEKNKKELWSEENVRDEQQVDVGTGPVDC